MKKTYIVISIVIIVIICGIICYLLFGEKNKINNTNIETEDKTKQENIIEEKSKTIENNISNEKEEEIDVDFMGYTSDEWKNMIEQFYGNYSGIQLSEIICKYDKDGNYTANVATEFEVCGEYVFDKETGLATEKNIGLTVDFINGRIVNQIKDKSKIFSDNICLAIGSVTKNNESKIIDKYFKNEASYNSITRYDFRNENSRKSDKGEKFVIIPKDEKVEISVYDCNIDENGNLQKEDNLIEKISEPFVLLYDNDEQTIPTICIEVKTNGFEDIIPIVFSGENGKLDLKGHETEILDISIY